MRLSLYWDAARTCELVAVSDASVGQLMTRSALRSLDYDRQQVASLPDYCRLYARGLSRPIRRGINISLLVHLAVQVKYPTNKSLTFSSLGLSSVQ